MKKVFALVLAVLMVMMCFAACGGNTDSTTPNGGNVGGNTTDPNSNATGGNTEKPTIVIGYTIYEPMNYEDENGKLIGFDTELAEAVFGNLGYEVMFQLIDWSARYTDLNSGTIDCIWNGFTCNSADDDGVMRSEKVDFSYNYMENRQVVVAKVDSGITTAADLAGKVAGVENGSAGETYANGFDDVMVTGFDYQTTALFEVKSGTVDFAVLDAQLAKSYCGKGDYADIAIVDGLSSDVEYYAIGFEKGSDLTAKVNAELEKLAADGTIAALAEKYGVASTAITDFSDQK